MAPIVPEDLDQALAAQERGESTLDAVEYSEDGPFLRLRAHPVEAVQTWRDMYEAAGFEKRSKLVWLLEDLCIPQSIEVLTELVDQPLPERTPQTGHHAQTPRSRAEVMQVRVFRALGRVSGAGCDALEAPTVARSGTVVSILESWVLDTGLHHHQRRLAGEALLTDHAARAAELRASLAANEQWMLTPFEERRVEMVVEDTPPDRVPKSEKALSPEDEDSSEEEDTPTTWAISSLCRITVLVGWPSRGDDYVSQMIDYWAWFTGEGCTQLRSRYDNDVDFQNNTWDEEFGYYYECSDNRPFKRMINALFILEHASSTPNPTGDYSGGVIHWAWDYVKRETPEFEGSCNTDGDLGTYYAGSWWPWSDEYIALHLPLWPQSVSIRAALILHEARHAGGYSHNANNSSCNRGASCDSRYGYRGANTIQVQWLAQYYRNGNIANDYLRDTARDRANMHLRDAYAQCPNVQLDLSGWFYSTPNACDL